MSLEAGWVAGADVTSLPLLHDVGCVQKVLLGSGACVTHVVLHVAFAADAILRVATPHCLSIAFDGSQAWTSGAAGSNSL